MTLFTDVCYTGKKRKACLRSPDFNAKQCPLGAFLPGRSWPPLPVSLVGICPSLLAEPSLPSQGSSFPAPAAGACPSLQLPASQGRPLGVFCRGQLGCGPLILGGPHGVGVRRLGCACAHRGPPCPVSLHLCPQVWGDPVVAGGPFGVQSASECCTPASKHTCLPETPSSLGQVGDRHPCGDESLSCRSCLVRVAPRGLRRAPARGWRGKTETWLPPVTCLWDAVALAGEVAPSL